MPLFRRPAPTSFRAEEISSSAASRRAFLKLGCACCAMLAAPPLAFGQTPSPNVAEHLAAAKEAAGSDLTAYLTLGNSADPNFKQEKPDLKALMDMPAPPPGKAFDNLYFVGSKWVSSWAITTSAGIILVDAMDNNDEAARIVEGGLKTLGLDPAEIKTIIITHGHGDHYGGVNYFVDKYKSRVVASEADWTMMETKLEFDTPLWGRPPKGDAGRHHDRYSCDPRSHHGHDLAAVRRLDGIAEASRAALGRHGLQFRQEARAAAGLY
jgi:metallo-beta-lactamase class B